MKNYIVSIVLVLGMNVFSQTKPTTSTTTTTTTTTKTTKTETKPAGTQTKPASTKTTTTTTTKSTKPASTTTKSKSTKPKSTKSTSKKSTTTTKPGDKVVKKALYTPKEREQTRQNFINEIQQIGMSPAVEAQYEVIVKKHWERIKAANKDRTLTKTEATEYVNRVINEQNSELQAILTPGEYDKHMLIMKRYQNSVLYRIEQQ